jgi:hypothetical protein
MRLRAWLILTVIITTMLPILAQRPSAPCDVHGPGPDFCGPVEERRLLDLYGLKPIAEHRAAGDEVRRAFFWDGFGGDVFAISFVHTSGHDPKVSVAFPKRSGEPPWTLDAVVPQSTWDDVVTRSEFFDRALVALPKQLGSESVCVDPPSALVESTDAADDPFDSGLRRQYGSSCDEKLAYAFGYELMKASLPLFAVCQSVKAEGPRSTLQACGKLRGDGTVAAEVLKLTDDLTFALTKMSSALMPEDPRGLSLAQDATIDWDGTRCEPGRAGEFLLARTGSERFSFMAVDIAIGESARAARVLGTLTRRSRDSAEVKFEVAPIEMQWTRDGLIGAFSLRRIVVGQFKPEVDR